VRQFLSDLISFDTKHRNGHFVADLQRFANPPGKNEHGTTFDFFLLGETLG
jgi:hypothetical protein